MPVMTDEKENYQVDTQAIRVGQQRSQFGEHAEALYLTSSYIFPSCEEAAARFKGESDGNVYSRYTNPTTNMFEQRLAAMEQGEAAVATSSGMAAIMSTLMSHLQSGDHVVCSSDVFGSTVVLINNFFVKFGIEVSYVPVNELEDWRTAVKTNTKLFFLETPSNPTNRVADIEALSKLAKSNDIIMVVDNCFCTPALQRPILFGADLVIHSATKYIDGQGRCLGGAVVGSKALIEPIIGFIRSGGPTMSAFNAWVFLKGLETLGVRMRAHSENALAIASWLTEQAWVRKVNYAGLESHPDHALAKKQQSQFGGVLSFEIEDDKAAAWRFIEANRLMSHTANLGDAKTTIVHPATTTHGRLTDEERQRAEISDNLIRIAVGLEDRQDLIAELERCASVALQ